MSEPFACSVCGTTGMHHGPHTEPALQCLDRHTDTDCDGPVELRYPLSPTGISYPRCDAHWAERLAVQEEIDRRYPQHAPDDFDPTYAGETWEEEDW